MNHSFNIDIAKEYGIEEAIILENLYFWLEKNKANNKHVEDGHVWTYNSQKAFSILFPYMNRSKIQRVMSKLEKENLILKGNYNEFKYDKTTWYALTPLGYSLFKTNIARCKSNNGLSESEQPIPDINSDINSDINTIHIEEKIEPKEIVTNENIYTNDFEEFYKLYPNSFNKEQTFKNWKTLIKTETKENIMLATKNYINFIADNKTSKQFITRSTNFVGQHQDYKGYLEYVKEAKVNNKKLEVVDNGNETSNFFTKKRLF